MKQFLIFLLLGPLLVPTFLGTWVEFLVHACKETAELTDQEKGFVTVASKAAVSLSSDSGY